MKIAAISSKKFSDIYEGSLKNNYLYQGAYSELDDDIGWNDFYLRNYDAQIGGWVQQDPYQEFASPYVGMGNDPVNFTDPSGGSIGLPCPGTSSLTIFLDKAVFAVTSFVSTYSSLMSALGAGANIASTGLLATQAIRSSDQINGILATMGVGVPLQEVNNEGISGDPINPKIVPLFIEQKRWPNVYNTMMQGALKGKPFLLTYDPSQSNARKRRRQALSGHTPAKPGNSLDEYPYACTKEGGMGSAVNEVPIDENSSHGGYVGIMVRLFNMKEGDKFLIIPIPDIPKFPKTVPSPAPGYKPAPPQIPVPLIPAPRNIIRPYPATPFLRRIPIIFFLWPIIKDHFKSEPPDIVI